MINITATLALLILGLAFFSLLWILVFYRLVRQVAPLFWGRIILLGGILLMFFLFFLPFPPRSTTLCSFCHGREVKVWKSSSHQRVSCQDCHGQNGLSGLFLQKLQDVRMVASSFRMTGGPIVALVSPENCLRCHQAIKKKTLRINQIKVSHKEFLESGDCLACHQETHNGLRERFSVMEKCLGCHARLKHQKNCQFCHLKKVSLLKAALTEGEHRGGWLKTHGKRSISFCTICHEKNYCKICHLQMPHPQNWSNLHDTQGRDEKACRGCHLSAFCQDCHKIEMPHPDTWLSLHSKKTGQGKLCYRCHLKRSCQECHEKHKHSPITGLLPKEATG